MNTLNWRAGSTLLRAFPLVICFLGTQAHARPASVTPALIQIGIEVVEVDEKKTQKLGIDWMDSIQVSETDVPAVLKLGTFTRDKITSTLHALLQEGAADLLANPKLVTRDNTTATFHAGGELPYATSGSLGTVSVEFKPYGVNLKISPHLEANNQISMSVDAEVSGPDDQNSVTLAGNIVPGIRSRQIRSELTLPQGHTLTMAGLIQNQKQQVTKGIPGLMHIPLLGALFRYKQMTHERTSIVVFITPTVLDIDKPADPLPHSADTRSSAALNTRPQIHEGWRDELLENLDETKHPAPETVSAL